MSNYHNNLTNVAAITTEDLHKRVVCGPVKVRGCNPAAVNDGVVMQDGGTMEDLAARGRMEVCAVDNLCMRKSGVVEVQEARLLGNR